MFSTTTNPFTSFNRMEWNLGTMLKVNGISYDVQQHLVRVYATLAACILSCAATIGASFYYDIDAINQNSYIGLFTLLTTTAGIIWLMMEPIYKVEKRMGILMMIAASLGLSLTSLINVAMYVDPSLVITAFLMTTTVFLCFSGAAMLATRREYLYLGALLSSALSMMLMANLLNLFFRSVLLYSVHLYGGLLIFCLYVIFDTQMIIEKASLGDRDFIKHTLELFLDFISIFTRILVILIKNSEKKKQNNHSKRRS